MRKNNRFATFATCVIIGFSSSDCIAQSLQLLVDRATGGGTIASTFSSIELTGYTIRSSQLLQPEGWRSLEDQAIAGWFEANSKPTVLGELNPTSSSRIESGETIELGSLFATGMRPSAEDISFTASLADGRVLEGSVEYVGAPNDIVLRVDPVSGVGRLELMSSFVEYELTGYTVRSDSGGLSAGWKSLADVRVEGWSESESTNTLVSEINTKGSTLFADGSVYWLGTLLEPNATHDLTLRFLTRDGDTLMGTVAYSTLVEPVYLDADFNESGTVDLADFLLLSQSFGNNVSTPGDDPDLSANGVVDFADFLMLSRAFGKSVEARPVPEPSGFALFGLGISFAGFRRRRFICRGGKSSSCH